MQLPLLEQDARFACGSCTACCDQPWRTQIEATKAHALERHDFSAYPHLAGKTYYHPPADGREGYFDLAKGEGTRCLFLDADGLCIIHKEMGAAAKPGMCLQFPYLASRTWTDDRVSLNYGCPSVQSCKGRPLAEQEAQIVGSVHLSMKPHKGAGLPIALDGGVSVTHDEYEKLLEHALALFDERRAGSVWTRFAELVGLLSAAREFKRAAPAGGPGLLQALSRDLGPANGGSDDAGAWDLGLVPEVREVAPLASASDAAMAARMLFAATLYPDSLPAEQAGRVGVFKRLMAMPRLMSLAKLSGTYASRVLGRNVVIDQVLRRPVAPELEPAAQGLLLRYFRSRFWQRLLVGTRLPILAGVHQHIHDFNAIVFFARAEAAERGENSLSEALIRKGMTCTEFHLANQTRVYEQTLKRWLRAQLCDAALALQSLRLMALPANVAAR